jgi:hypothetical protein
MKPPLSIYVLVDALGWEIIRDRPFLDDVLEDRRCLQTILGYSSGAIPTLLSGRLPSQHGHWNLFYRSPATSPFRWTRPLRRLPAALVDNPFARRAVKHLSRHLSGYSGYFSIYAYPVHGLAEWDLTEKRDIYQPGGLDCPSIFDRLLAHDIPYECYNYHGHTDPEILALGARRAVESDARVLFLYLADLDRYLHHFIDDAAGVSERLAWYEAGLSRIYRAAREVRDARMLIFSDHGMTPTRWTYDLRRDVAALGLTDRDYLAAYDSTMARFWTDNERARARLVELLAEHPCGELLEREELTRLGVWFDDDRYYQMLFVMKPGVLLNPSDMGHFRFAGMHGYHPSDPTADAVLLSTTPLDKAVNHIAGIHDLLLAGVTDMGGLATGPPNPPDARRASGNPGRVSTAGVS